VTYSLGEIEAVARKATRAVGYPWGVADEAAKSARWLCSQGIDGCAALNSHLKSVDGKDVITYAPSIKGNIWSTDKFKPLCPLLCGCALIDFSHIFHDHTVELLNVNEPVLLIFFAAQIARQYREKNSDGVSSLILVTVENNTAETDGERLKLSVSLQSNTRF